MTEIEVHARDFATARHAAAGQVRKYSGEPYINHSAAVVELVRSVAHTPAMLAAAWLHDTVEDTDATLDDIARDFGAEVAQLVEMLTNVSRATDGDRATRKRLDREHLSRANRAAKTIKLADVIDNTRDIAQRDPEFATVYLAEKALLLEGLRDGDATLWRRADELVHSTVLHAPRGARGVRG